MMNRTDGSTQSQVHRAAVLAVAFVVCLCAPNRLLGQNSPKGTPGPATAAKPALSIPAAFQDVSGDMPNSEALNLLITDQLQEAEHQSAADDQSYMDTLEQLKSSEQAAANKIKELDKRMRELLAIQIGRHLQDPVADKTITDETIADNNPAADGTAKDPTAQGGTVPAESSTNLQPAAPGISMDKSVGQDTTHQLSKITERPVDQLALADSLYQSEELEMALEIYSKLEQVQEFEKHVNWIRLQMGSCYRRTGQHNDSAKYYRMVANSTDDEFVVPLAKWWLDYIEKKSVLMDQKNRIRMFNDRINTELGNGPDTGQ